MNDSNGHDDRRDDGTDEREPGEVVLTRPPRETWIQYAVISLGIWLIFSPMSLGYESVPMTVSDVITGVVLVTLSGVTILRDNPWTSYANGVVGLWLLLAPLVLHAPTAVAYANDTLVGILVIAFSIVVATRAEVDGAAVPPGWSYDPSTAAQRAPLIALALFGFLASRYMGAYQLGYVGVVWDPVFGDGTMRVLDSRISAAFPVSDAGLGAVAYAVGALLGFTGDRTRWRTMPWVVALFGVVVVSLGVVQVLLVLSQPLLVGAWCTLCLLSAFGTLWMIALSFDEVVATLQLLDRRTDEGVPLWRAFWLGGTLSEEEAGLPDDGTRSDLDRPAGTVWGVSLPWELVVAMALGLWLMLSPTVLGTSGVLADSSHLLGTLVVSFTVIATAEPARSLRFVTVLLGFGVIAAPWVLGRESVLVAANGAAVGAALVILDLPRGTIRDRYGSWQRYIA